MTAERATAGVPRRRWWILAALLGGIVGVPLGLAFKTAVTAPGMQALSALPVAVVIAFVVVLFYLDSTKVKAAFGLEE